MVKYKFSYYLNAWSFVLKVQYLSYTLTILYNEKAFNDFNQNLICLYVTMFERCLA